MDNEYVVIVDNDLYHHGIIGMKWGRRRYQNKDGSLTAAGKKRYEAEAAKLKEREKTVKNREKVAAQQAKLDAKKANLDARERVLDADKIAAKEAKAQAKAARKAERQAKKNGEALKTKTIKDMTDDELIAAIARKQLEDRYNQLHPQAVSKGKQFVDKVLNEVIVPSAVTLGKDALSKFGNKLLKKVMPDDPIDPNSLEGLKVLAEKSKYRKEIAENNQKAKEAAEGKKKPEVPDADNWDAMNKRADYAAKYGPNGELDPSRNPSAFTRRSNDGANGGSTTGKSDKGSTKTTSTDTTSTKTTKSGNSSSSNNTSSLTDKAINKLINKGKNNAVSEYKSWKKDYEKNVDDALEKLDNKGWATYLGQRDWDDD